MMEFLRFILTVPVLVALVAFPVSTQEGTDVLIACSDDAHYANGSTYATNVKSVLSSISANNLSSYGFYNISTGENTDKVYAVSLCRGDISQSNCNSCLDFATTDIYSRCPTQKAAIAWYDNCMLRFSNQSIFGTLDPIYHTSFNPDNVSNPDLFNRALSTLLNDLRDQASLGNSSIKFAVGDTNYTNFGRIYALVQCTPDLSSKDCGRCLDWAFTHLSGVSVTIGGRVFCGSCNIRYDISQFYNPGDSLLPQPSLPNHVNCANEDTTNIMRTVIITLSTILSMILIICILLFVHARWKRGKPKNIVEIVGAEALQLDADEVFLCSDADVAESPKFLQYDFESVKAWTNDFSDDNKLGKGGFGAVYQGKDVDGQLLAVKRLAAVSNQGDVEFKNEVLSLEKLQHKNLVTLLGFCLEGEERLLIYEFMPNGSLDKFLFGPLERQDLDWETRYKIICGIARGLLYLHEDSKYRVIHRDLKASNVLLDKDMTPKIADFGMARLFPDDQTKGQTSRVAGTHGYMAPEYGLQGQFSVKSDVYSFGVLVLEIVSGRKNIRLVDEETAEDLISLAWGSWRAGTAPDIIDPALRDGSRNEIVHCIHIGLLCVQKSVALRPNMAFVAAALLIGNSITLPAPAVPGFYLQDDNESEMPMLGQRSTGKTAQINSKDNLVTLPATAPF